MTDLHRKELHDKALLLSGQRAGSPEYLKCYRQALKTIEDGLSEEAKAMYRVEAKKWTEEKPPFRQQQR